MGCVLSLSRSCLDCFYLSLGSQQTKNPTRQKCFVCFGTFGRDTKFWCRVSIRFPNGKGSRMAEIGDLLKTGTRTPVPDDRDSRTYLATLKSLEQQLNRLDLAAGEASRHRDRQNQIEHKCARKFRLSLRISNHSPPPPPIAVLVCVCGTGCLSA